MVDTGKVSALLSRLRSGLDRIQRYGTPHVMDVSESAICAALEDILHVVSCVKCHFSTILAIVMHQFEDRCHNSMHSYANIVSKSVYHGSNEHFLGVFVKLCCHR